MAGRRGDGPERPWGGRDRRSFLAAAAALPALAACGFEPVYAPGAPASRLRGRVAVPTLEGAAGFALRERLVERLGEGGDGAYRLAVDLDIREEGAAITLDNITTRFLVIGTAVYRLTPPGAAEPVLAETARAQTAYSAPTGDTASAFAARAAAIDARDRVARALADQIALALAVSAEGWLGPAP